MDQGMQAAHERVVLVLACVESVAWLGLELGIG
jgi:hypothetical protein